MALVHRIKIQKNILKYLIEDIWKMVHSYMQYEDAQLFYESFTDIKLEIPIRPTTVFDPSSGMFAECREGTVFANIENIYLSEVGFHSCNHQRTITGYVTALSRNHNLYYKCMFCEQYIKLRFHHKKSGKVLIRFYSKLLNGKIEDTWLCECCSPEETYMSAAYPVDYFVGGYLI